MPIIFLNTLIQHAVETEHWHVSNSGRYKMNFDLTKIIGTTLVVAILAYPTLRVVRHIAEAM